MKVLMLKSLCPPFFAVSHANSEQYTVYYVYFKLFLNESEDEIMDYCTLKMCFGKYFAGTVHIIIEL